MPAVTWPTRAAMTWLALASVAHTDRFDEEAYGVKYASDCEVCKIVSGELLSLLSQSSGKSEVLETGYSMQKAKKKTAYVKSELRLIEAMDEVCERLLDFRIHKERTDSSRFARGMSETFRALEGLVAKGVKVDLGMPQQLWHKPSAEITHLKTQCEALLEQHEDAIEEWYLRQQHDSTTSLTEYLCRQRVLRHQDSDCLDDHLKQAKGERQEL